MARAPTPPAIAVPARRRHRGATVLVVDDDPTVRDLMARYLTSEGFSVVTAADGVEALARAPSCTPPRSRSIS